MPKYVYKCDACDGSFEVIHGMTENQDCCHLCDENGPLVRIPQMLSYIKNQISKESVGTEVKKAIEDNLNILNEQKREAKSQEWDP